MIYPNLQQCADRILTTAASDIKGSEQMCIKLMEEVGELAEVINHFNGYLPHKTMKETAFGEAADVIQCTLTILQKMYPHMTNAQIIEEVERQLTLKTDKWESVMVRKPNNQND